MGHGIRHRRGSGMIWSPGGDRFRPAADFHTPITKTMLPAMIKALLISVLIFASGMGQAMEVIVSREDRAIAIYLRMPFEDTKGLFGRDVPGFTDEDGNIRYSDLSQGTFDGGDILAKDVVFTLGGQSVEFETMSMMVHMEGFDVPFITPLDAVIAIGVCGVPIPEEPPEPEDLVWIGGWYAYPVDEAQEITVTFPKTGREARDAELRIYRNAVLEKEYTELLADGGTYIIPFQKPWWKRILGQ